MLTLGGKGPSATLQLTALASRRAVCHTFRVEFVVNLRERRWLRLKSILTLLTAHVFRWF